MAQHSVRQKDIAEKLGLSRATVTRALLDDPRIAEATRLAVREAAEDMGYVPNTLGRALAIGHHPVVGVVLFGGLYFGIDGLGDALQGTDWAVQLSISPFDTAQQIDSVRRLLSSRVAGLVFCTYFAGNRTHIPGVEFARERGMPLVLEGTQLEYPGVPQVTFDFAGGMELALRQLQGQGHTRVGLVYEGIEMWEHVFTPVAEKLGITPTIRATGAPQVVPLSSVLDEMLGKPDSPTALILSSVSLAIEFDRYRWQRGLRVPDDLSIIAIQFHSLWLRHIYDSYPFLVFDGRDSTREATRVLLRMLETGQAPERPVLVPGYVFPPEMRNTG